MSEELNTVYQMLFVDSIEFSLIVPPRLNCSLFKTFISFHDKYNVFLVVLIASLGSLFATLINWLLGKMCRSIPIRSGEDFVTLHLAFLERYQRRFVSMACIPFFGSIVMLGCGYFRIPVKRVIVYGYVSHFVYYMSLLLISQLPATSTIRHIANIVL